MRLSAERFKYDHYEQQNEHKYAYSAGHQRNIVVSVNKHDLEHTYNEHVQTDLHAHTHWHVEQYEVAH